MAETALGGGRLNNTARATSNTPMLGPLRSLVTLLTLAVSVALAAPAGADTLRDRSGSSTGSIERDGTVRDRSGSSLGRFDPNGTIRDRSGGTMGHIDDNGTIRDRSGSSVGRMDPDGTVRDRSGSTLGKVESSGTVRDRSGSTLGSGGTTRPIWVAVRFFFWGTLL